MAPGTSLWRKTFPAAAAFGLPWGLLLGFHGYELVWSPNWSLVVLVTVLPFALFWMSAYVAARRRGARPSLILALLAGCAGAVSSWIPWSGPSAYLAYFLWPAVAGFCIPLLPPRLVP